ncbi:1,3-beta-glucanosyltransferase [Entomortierella chlamydospora]|nr:1,3-beta-glucanosyltransferase [Entomortierella chlamydospora]
MKITALVSLAAAVLAFADASPVHRPSHRGTAVSLTRNRNYKHNVHAEINKLNKRYPSLQILAASGTVPLTDVNPDVEYYGSVSVGTPAQVVKLDFDTGSSDIWFPSTSCTTTACKKHTRFNTSQSSTYKKDGRSWSISYGDGSSASGTLGSDIVSVGGISVRQTIGLATKESSQFGSSPEDGLFGLGFASIESVSGVLTFMDNAIAAGVVAEPVVSVFLPSERVFNGEGGEYIFGGIDSSKYTGSLTYVPVTQEGYWQISVDDIGYNGQSLGQSSQGIVDTGTTLIIVGDDAAQAIHDNIEGAYNDYENGWIVPCSLQSSSDSISFSMGGSSFNVAIADLAFEDLGDGSGNCFSGVQGGQDDLWILGDVFIKNNYCVFDHGNSQIGIAPLAGV